MQSESGCRQIKSLGRRNERRDEKGLKVLHFYQRDIILKKSFTLSVHLSPFDTDSFVIRLLPTRKNSNIIFHGLFPECRWVLIVFTPNLSSRGNSKRVIATLLQQQPAWMALRSTNITQDLSMVK